MNIRVLKCKLHRAKVTHRELDYEGSCGIDANWMKQIGLYQNEQVHIYNITNGERFITYAFEVEAGSTIVTINGAAAHKVKVNDLVIVCAYADIDQKEIDHHQPKILSFNH